MLSLGAALAGCAPDRATIAVEADEPIESAQLVLNDKNVGAKRTSESSFAGKWDGGEASGEFRIRMRDGAQVVCKVGYLEGTSFYREEFAITDRRCEPLP